MWRVIYILIEFLSHLATMARCAMLGEIDKRKLSNKYIVLPLTQFCMLIVRGPFTFACSRYLVKEGVLANAW